MVTACPTCEPYLHPEGTRFRLCPTHEHILDGTPASLPRIDAGDGTWTLIDIGPCPEHGYGCSDGPECWTCCEGLAEQIERLRLELKRLQNRPTYESVIRGISTIAGVTEDEADKLWKKFMAGDLRRPGK